jgi:hypothetical protein
MAKLLAPRHRIAKGKPTIGQSADFLKVRFGLLNEE